MATILLIDDDDDGLDVMRAALTEAGHAVVAVGDARHGLELLATRIFDVVVLEMILADKEGAETVREIRQRWPELPVIAMTAGGRWLSVRDTLAIAEGFGADATLAKPFSRSELLHTVDLVLAKDRDGRPEPPRSSASGA